MSVDRESQVRQYIEEIVDLHVQEVPVLAGGLILAGLTLDHIKALQRTVVIRTRASIWSAVAVTPEVSELVRQLSPQSLGVSGIELSYYPDLSRSTDNGSGNRSYRTDLTIAARLPAPPVPEDMREIVRINQAVQAQFGWQYGILPNEIPPMDRILFNLNVSPMSCGVLGSEISLLSLAGGIEFKQHSRRDVKPEIVASVAQALAQFQPLTRYDSKTVKIL